MLPSLLMHHVSNRTSQRNIKMIVNFLVALVLLVVFYSVMFHYIMVMEGEEYSWITGFYWTLTVMSTLGFGDITFHSDIGKLFSIVVLLSGIVFLLVMLPFTFIEFFYEPWIKAQTSARVPRQVPATFKGHVILFQYDQITSALIEKLKIYHYPYVLVIPDFDEALRLHDEGFQVVYGEHDNPETYKKLQIDQATLIATTRSDVANTTIAFTVRDVNETIPIVATARDEFSVEVLKKAGCNTTLDLGEMTGLAFARRVHGGAEAVHMIGQFNDLIIAEANAEDTPYVGKTLINSDIRKHTGVNVVGIWERGKFEIAQAQTVIQSKTVLVLTGTREQINKFEQVCRSHEIPTTPVVIIGGGRVGRATAKALQNRGIDYRIVEKLKDRMVDRTKLVTGNAANPAVLKKAMIDSSPAAIITTRDDDTNIYLTIYLRRRVPDIQLISRTSLKRNVNTLHRAGADFVISYASMGADKIFNLLKRSDILMIAEGLDVFRIKTPKALTGKYIHETTVRADTGCNIVSVHTEGATFINPESHVELKENSELVLIGTDEAENRFLQLYAE